MKILMLGQKEEMESISEQIKSLHSNSRFFLTESLSEAEKYAKKNNADLIVSDTKVQGEDTFLLLNELKTKKPKLNILLISKDTSHKEKALDLKVSGYLLKPCDKKELKKELDDLRYPIKEEGALLRAQCFGNFSVFDSEGDPVHFSRSKEKEILAYLIYKHGTSVTTRELAAVLFEDDYYDKKQQTYLQQLFHSLSKDLRTIGADEVIIRDYNSTSVDVSLIDCDYYRFSNNEAIAKRLYTGEFMVQYAWADYVAGYLDRKA